jgi:hypothetical protein
MPLPEDATMRAANHAVDEQRKKKKDVEKKKEQKMAKAQLHQGRWRQGLEEEEDEEEDEEEEEGAYGSGLPV